MPLNSHTAYNYIVSPVQEFVGHIDVPASKSHAQRALALALISQEKSTLHGIGRSADELAALSVLKQAGCSIKHVGDALEITGIDLDQLDSGVYAFGESGLCSRMLTPILSNAKSPLTLSGEGSLLVRPMHFFESFFHNTNVHITTSSGCLPLKIQGPLKPKHVTLDGSLSSQFITGVIYGYIASKHLDQVTLQVDNPTSVPYIELSLSTLKSFGVDLRFTNNTINFDGPYRLASCDLTIEGDWSSASFFMVAAAINGTIHFSNLDLNSKQADKRILDAIIKFGAQVHVDETITVSRQENYAFDFDATHCPDLFPPLAVLASQANGACRIRGVHRLLHKESNRSQAIQQEFEKFGITVEIIGDEMVIFPQHELKTPKTINTHNDHRIAMACAILGTLCKEPVQLEEAHVVNKSFPTFYDLLESCSTKRSDTNPVNC